MRILLNTIGTAGDVHPFIAVALALKNRGHEVVIVANPAFAARINGAGIGFWPMGAEADYIAFVKNADLVKGSRSVNYVIRDLIVANFMPAVEAITIARQAFRPDVVVAHHISFGAKAACDKIGLPYAQCVLAPLFWLSRHEPVLLPSLPLREPPPFVDRFLRAMLKPIGRFRIDRPINKLRKQMGLAPERDLIVHSARGGDGILPPDRVADPDKAVMSLGLWSEHFRPAMPDDPVNGAICGFAVWDRPVTTVERQRAITDVAEWMTAGAAPVLVTLGSSVAHHGASVYRTAAEACKRLGKRCVLLTGPGGEQINDEHCRSLEYAPYSMLMPRAMAVVHHAGIGTTAAALRAGRPSLIVPHANDEFDNADRVRRLGAGFVLPPRKASPHAFAAILDRIVNDRTMTTRTKAMGEKLMAENGAAKAAVKIEGLVK